MFEKIFEKFPYLPSELQSQIVVKMRPDDRCRFGSISKHSRKEAISSKNYAHELILFCTPNIIRIVVVFEKYESYFSNGYILEFRNVAGKFFKRHINPSLKTLWEVELDNSTNLARYAIEEFKNILQHCQRSIKVLRLNEHPYSEMLKHFDFGSIKKFVKLETLKVDGDMEIQQILSKLRRPLKNLIFTGRSEGLETCEQIYQVQDNLILWNVDLNYEQFLNLSARFADIPIGKLTENDIFKFIRSWQNGTIKTGFEACRWYFKGSDFNEQKLFGFCGVDDETHVKLESVKKPGEFAVLWNTEEGLLFCRKF